MTCQKSGTCCGGVTGGLTNSKLFSSELVLTNKFQMLQYMVDCLIFCLTPLPLLIILGN